MIVMLWLLMGMAMGWMAARKKASQERPGFLWIDVAFGALGASLGGAAGMASVGEPIGWQDWSGWVGAVLGAALALAVASLHWWRERQRR